VSQVLSSLLLIDDKLGDSCFFTLGMASS